MSWIDPGAGFWAAPAVVSAKCAASHGSADMSLDVKQPVPRTTARHCRYFSCMAAVVGRALWHVNKVNCLAVLNMNADFFCFLLCF